MDRFGIKKMSNVPQINSGVTEIKIKTPTAFFGTLQKLNW